MAVSSTVFAFLLIALLLVLSNTSVLGFHVTISHPRGTTGRPVTRLHNDAFSSSLPNADSDTTVDDSYYDTNVIPQLMDEEQAQQVVLASSSLSSTAIYYDPEDDIDCRAPQTRSDGEKTKLIFLVSDATGITAKAAVAKSLAQFIACEEENGRFDIRDDDNDDDNSCQSYVKTRSFTFIRSEATMLSILETASKKNACVMFTLVNPDLRRKASQHCDENGVMYVDLLGPVLDRLSTFFGRPAVGIPMLSAHRERAVSSPRLGDSYYRRIDAVEFTLKCDDGKSPWLLHEADVVLVGVSRSGKTPLSVVLAQTMGLKVSNVPLVVECPPPKELLTMDDEGRPKIDPRRVFCLTIAPSELRRIRTTRLDRRKVTDIESKYEETERHMHSAAITNRKSNYNDRSYVMNDLKNAKDLSLEHGWTIIDVTGRAVEETASLIVEILNDRFESKLSTSHLA